jgi:hypothetical protein
MASFLDKYNKYSKLGGGFMDNFVVMSNWFKEVLGSEQDGVFITIKEYSPYINRMQVEKTIQYVMSKLFRELIGRGWYKKQLKFIGFVEKGRNNCLHTHIICNIGEYSFQEVVDSFHRLSTHIKFDIGSKYKQEFVFSNKRRFNKNIVLSNIYCKEGLYSYCAKELNLKSKNINTDNLITYNMLFEKMKDE